MVQRAKRFHIQLSAQQASTSVISVQLTNLRARHAYAVLRVCSSLPGVFSTLSDPDSSLVRIGLVPDGRVCGVAAFLHVCSCLAVEPVMPTPRSVASLCPADKSGCASQAGASCLGAALRSLGPPSRAEQPAPEGVPRASLAMSPPYFRSHIVGYESQAYELSDGDITTVGVERSRGAEMSANGIHVTPFLSNMNGNVHICQTLSANIVLSSDTTCSNKA